MAHSPTCARCAAVGTDAAGLHAGPPHSEPCAQAWANGAGTALRSIKGAAVTQHHAAVQENPWSSLPRKRERKEVASICTKVLG